MFGNLWAKITGSVQNAASGQGGSGDMAGAAFVERPRIPAHRIEAMLRQEPLLRNALEAMPEDIVRAWRTVDDKQAAWTDLEEELSYHDTVEGALFAADAFGGAVVVPRYDTDAVPESALAAPFAAPRKNSLLGWRIYYPQQLRRPQNGALDSPVQPGSDLPEVYEIERRRKHQDNLRIHYTWTIPVHGPRRVASWNDGAGSLTCEELFGDSKADMFYDHLMRALSGMGDLSHLLSKSNVDALKLVGLAAAISKCTTTEEMFAALHAAKQRAMHAAQGSSVYQPILLDSQEEFIRSGLGQGANGAPDIAAALVDMYVAITKVPRTRLLGQQAKGLNNGGEADFAHYYDRTDALRERRATRLLNAMDQLVIADRGLTTPIWEYGDLFAPSAKEQAEIEGKRAERDKKYIDAGLPFIVSKVTERLARDKVYAYTDAEVEEIQDTEGPPEEDTSGAGIEE